MRLLVLIAAASLLLQEPVLPPGILPDPRGSNPVGTTTLHWIDDKRGEDATADETDKRELMVQLWYPVAKAATGPRAKYLPWFDELRHELAYAFRAHERKLKRVEVPAIQDAPPLGGAKLPVVVLSHGLGQSRHFYSSHSLELASHGYLVATLDHTYDVEGTVFPGPRLVERAHAASSEAEKAAPASGGTKPASARLKTWAADLSFVLDQLGRLAAAKEGPFAGRVDLGRVAVLGHCYGAEAAILVCARDKRFKACLNENGWPLATEAQAAGLTQPLLVLWGKETQAVQHLKSQGVEAKVLAELMAKFRAEQRQVLQTLGTTVTVAEIDEHLHMDFTDLPMLAAWVDGKEAAMQQPARLRLVLDYVVAFCDAHLRQRRPELLSAKAPHPGVDFAVLPAGKRPAGGRK